MRKLLPAALCILLTATSPILHSQTTKTEVGFSGSYITITDLGERGCILSCLSENTVNVCRFDLSGKQLWKKSISYKKNFSPIFCASPNGDDFYVLMYWKNKTKGGTEGLTISRINSDDGTIETKEHPEAAPGHALLAYATNTALYVVTSDKEWSDHKSDDYTTSLVRFSRNDLNFTLGNSDMALKGDRDKFFWQCYKVDQNFIEGYRVVELAGQLLKIEIARFDTLGKKIFSKSTDIQLKKGFPYPTNTDLPMYKSINGVVSTITSWWPNSDGPALTDLMGMGHLIYDEVNGGFTVFGAIGPKEYKNYNNKLFGYYVARLDADFNLTSLMEFDNVSLISSSVLGGGLAPKQRYFVGFLQPDNKLGFMMYALKSQVNFIHDATSLQLKSSANYSKDWFATRSAFLPDVKDLLWYDSKVTEESGHFKGAHLATTRTMQYVCLYSYGGSEAWFYSKKMK